MKMGWKVITLAGMVLLMLLTLGLVRSLLDERQQRAGAVQEEIAQFSASEQQLGGPYLVLPYTVNVQRWETPDGDAKQAVWKDSTEQKQLVLSPAQLRVDGKLAVELLKRGLFEAPIYRSQLQLAGSFRVPALAGYEQTVSNEREKRSTRWGTPYLAFSLSDVRGIQQLNGQLGGKALAFMPGARLDSQRGAHAVAALADLAVLRTEGQQLAFSLGLQLAGSQALLIEPSGDSTTVNLAGNWPHPSFAGNFAPQSRSVNAQGFQARWQTSELATGGNVCQQEKPGCVKNQIGLRLLDPVDRYVLNERTMKYAELFVLLMMGGVFLLEVINRVSVHPVQYTLVMLGLAMFFLLTLSLSEHVGFNLAYCLAALASVLLQGAYGSSVLRSWRSGAVLAAMLAALFGLLFMILQSQDMALLMGSLALFALLALTMYLTRHIDWGSLGAAPKVASTAADKVAVAQDQA